MRSRSTLINGVAPDGLVIGPLYGHMSTTNTHSETRIRLLGILTQTLPNLRCAMCGPLNTSLRRFQVYSLDRSKADTDAAIKTPLTTRRNHSRKNIISIY